ncbi:MAG: transglycosylase SLT domain-containing protein [Paracoccaceae bacterium]
MPWRAMLLSAGLVLAAALPRPLAAETSATAPATVPAGLPPAVTGGEPPVDAPVVEAAPGTTAAETAATLASAGPAAVAPDATALRPGPGFAPPAMSLRPKLRDDIIPVARWQHRPEATRWTRAALRALKDHGTPLVQMVPGDIQTWCPAYPGAGPAQRRAFWVGFLSALTKHESTYRPEAVGGGGLWYGLLQILPSTARLYKCRARTGAELKNGSANLSCAIRIMAKTVPRDGVIHAYTKSKSRRWRGVSADWGPMRSASKRADMAGWLRRQSYCKPMRSVRPKARPEGTVAQSVEMSPG